MYFYLFTLSSNQTLFIHYRCFLDQAGKIRKWNICQGLCSVFLLPMLDACQLVIWVLPSLGLCSSVYLLSKINTPLQVPASM